jgi:hypothetical protein
MIDRLIKNNLQKNHTQNQRFQSAKICENQRQKNHTQNLRFQSAKISENLRLYFPLIKCTNPVSGSVNFGALRM